MTTSKQLGLIACLICGLAGTSPAAGQSRDLIAGTLPGGELGALPSRARKSAAPDITNPLKLEALRNETYPGLRSAVVVPETVVRLVGSGFGGEAGGRVVRMKLSSSAEPLSLEIVSWRDDEIRVRLPALTELGIDAKSESSMRAQLSSKKHLVGPTAEIGIALDSNWVIKPRVAQLAVVYRDLDGDGHEADDCDDFDARRFPGNLEIKDAANVDEDCDPATEAKDPLGAGADPLAL